jgi:hypothetical protein
MPLTDAPQHHMVFETLRSRRHPAYIGPEPLPELHVIVPPAGRVVETPCVPFNPTLIVWAIPLESVQETVNPHCAPFDTPKFKVVEAPVRFL